MFYKEDIDSKEVSGNVLKMCNVIRAKHFKANTLFKKTGKGGGPGGSIGSELNLSNDLFG